MTAERKSDRTSQIMEHASTKPLPDLPLPQTVEDAEKVIVSRFHFACTILNQRLWQLIQDFYRPGSARNVERIDRCLKELQKSDQAFFIADALLARSDGHVQFFGALTFTVKINRDW